MSRKMKKKRPQSRPAKPPRGAGKPSKSGPKPASLPKGVRQVIGIHSCREVLSVRPEQVIRVWLKRGWELSQELLEFGQWAEQHRRPLEVRSQDSLDKVGSGNQGICLFVKGKPELNWEALDEDRPQIVMVLDGIEDPHNLGAVMRTAWLMGVEALIVPELRSVHMTPTVAKVASGAAEHVPLIIENQFPQLLSGLKEKGFWVYGLAAGGSQSLWSTEFSKKVVWVLGSESKGIRTSVEKACDELVHIPQVEAKASYNASVAAAIAIAETCRQVKRLEK